jgi:hypothetical protein
MHAHARVHACAHHSSTASQGCVSVSFMCECVYCCYFANPSTVSVCLSVHVRPDACIYNAEVLSMCNKHLMLGQTAVLYTHKYTHSTHIQHFHSSTVLCKQPRETLTHTEAMKARQKCRVAGLTTGFWRNQATCMEEKPKSWQTAVRSIQISKQ